MPRFHFRVKVFNVKRPLSAEQRDACIKPQEAPGDLRGAQHASCPRARWPCNVQPPGATRTSHRWVVPSVLGNRAWRWFSVKTKPAALRTDRTSSDRPLASDGLCQQPEGACPRPRVTCSHHLNHIFPSRCVGHGKQLGGGSQENTARDLVIWGSHEMSNVPLLFLLGHALPSLVA